jgi:hypothetical protein
MALSSHRKLNVEQLINLAQVYWDDPGKLLEIVEATEARMDPAAQLLFGAVTNRLNRLRSDPLRALGQTPPDLAALIAARLGTQPAAAETTSDPDDVPPESEAGAEEPRRRWPWAAGAALLLVAAGAWWLWPRPEKPETAAASREIGIAVQEGGLRPLEEADNTGTASGLPPGRRRPQFPERSDLDRREHDESEDELENKLAASGAAALKARVPEAPPAKAVADIAEPREAAVPTGGRASPAGGSGAAGSSTATREPAVAPRSAARAADAGRGRAGAEIAIEEALLQCYLTDRRPTACAPAGGGGAANPPAAPSAGRGGPTGGGAPPEGSREAAASTRSGNRAAGASSPGERSQQSGAGSGGGSGSASGGGPPPVATAADDGASSAGQRPSASASAGGGGEAAGAAKKTPPQQPQVATQTLADPDCPDQPPAGRVVFIFDGSISMGLPLGVDPAEEDRLDDGVRRRDPEARRAYRALLQQPGPKRMGRAQAAFSDAATELPETVELGLVVFQECRDIRSVGVFDAAARGSAIDYVQRLIPHGRTPLAQSLASAATMLGDGPSSIVLLTDGIEFCSGDPCAVAEEVKAAHPQTPIHIIDVTGQARTACVAEITGGRSYAPAETDDLTAVIRNAFRGAAPRCAAPG